MPGIDEKRNEGTALPVPECAASQRATGGRIKSDLRFSATVVWSNLPLPNPTDRVRQQIIEAGKGILEARAQYPDRSLADHYNPLAMSPALIKAHDAQGTDARSGVSWG
ncbi:type IIL restriction-modification enzyme MmeI [Brachybacterium sacelli]|uniref:MmeI-like C-terminal domain-containing protein n=1 Tax=Brachybacterium sacelli TaxID=173364 RepID=A0ABS4X3H1_9MICO|nr:hypothetical protein [Brachybacterium sacelli]MBP2382886.1 hypothetical protein [Brachybacterium sacelli]MBP2384481.1 hypothetical protein [Brachybacterium sacelli]